MDYKTFLDFVLAMEFKKTPQALHYFWRLLDIKKEGYLDCFTIMFFFREIVRRMERNKMTTRPVNDDDSTIPDNDKIRADDVSDEIFDMAKPVDPARITLPDLLRCGTQLPPTYFIAFYILFRVLIVVPFSLGVGDTIVTMLTDYNGFWQYDNRECLAGDDSSCNDGGGSFWGRLPTLGGKK